MNEYPLTSRVKVSFRRSSSKDAGEGFDVEVEEGATEEEAKKVMELAIDLRRQAMDEVTGKSLAEQLEESLR